MSLLKMSSKLTNEQLLDMLDGMNSDLELSDDEDDDNVDDIDIANEILENIYDTDDGEDDDNIDEIDIVNETVERVYDTIDNEDDGDIFIPDQLPIQIPPTDEVSVPNIVSDTNTSPILKQFSTFAKSSIKWLCKPMKQKNIVLRSLEQTEFPSTIPPPISYFMKYFPEEAFSKMAIFTNIYAEQKSTNKWVQTTSAEMKVFVGIHLMMGVLNLPRVRMYWQKEFRIEIIASNMTRNRFFELRTHFHVMNNEEIPQTNIDKFIKVRPLYNYMKHRFHQLPIERNISIDEQMVPFKGKLAPKQYMRGKPHPWGIKLFLMCGSSGIVYDFIMFQGSSTELDPVMQNLFGQGGAVVMQFIERLEENRHFVYFDNYFTSYNLLSVLADRKIYAAGTVRVNRFANPPLITDKCLSKMGRGTSYEVSGIAQGQKSEIGLIKWFDNKGVNLGSNFITSGEPETIKRWDKKHKKFVDVERPEVIGLYNKSMGGVDVHDQLVSFYRTFIKSRKWTLRLIAHAFDMASVNSWLEYKKDVRHNTILDRDTMDLLAFKERLATTLISLGRTKSFITPPRKRGRPSTSPSPTPEPEAQIVRTKPRSVDSTPYEETIKDGFDHMPTFDNKQNSTRCKNAPCTFKTHVYCDKCNIHLCFIPGRECYRQKHRE
ncbi:hypothetical protein AGLY_017010 [Aphis glycines]|uniref:PiggyBac transposable element-derived protein domain-containing protein n=1 Tax=Aphis glycines TaxID=307491 RepID=A0A6G0SWR0_APHGL|nr:hypothetical protein AGLY_017010 [Aphis glycines]